MSNLKVFIKTIFSLVICFSILFPIVQTTSYADSPKKSVGEALYKDSNLAPSLVDATPQATITGSTIPDAMIAGRTYEVSVTVRNDGQTPWTEAQMFRLGAVNDTDPFAIGRHLLPSQVSVAPGQSFTFNFVMTAPSQLGTYWTDWAMVQEYVTWFGQIYGKNVNVVSSLAGSQAAIVADTLPAVMLAGKSYPVTITLRNDGTDTWDEKDLYRLGVVGDDGTFAASRQLLGYGVSIEPGQQYTFSFMMTAPVTAGTYGTGWSMVHDGVEWFGQALYKTVQVVNTANFMQSAMMSNTIPDVMIAGMSYPVTITVRNDGTSPWSESSLYRLGAMYDNDPFASTRQLIASGVTVQPGQTYSFAFTMKAPNAPRRYLTDWEMVNDGAGWFGPAMSKYVNVIPNSYEYGYDANNRLQYVHSLLGLLYDYRYDANGNQLSRGRFQSVFESGWESHQPAGLMNTLDQPAQNVEGYASGLPIQAKSLPGGDQGVLAKAGKQYLVVAGNDTSATAASTAVLRLFDSLNISVKSGMHLRYWVYHYATWNSQKMAMDLVFSDGTTLSQSSVTDQYGVPVKSASRNEPLNQWVLVDADLTPLAGKTISKVVWRVTTTSREPGSSAVILMI